MNGVTHENPELRSESDHEFDQLLEPDLRKRFHVLRDLGSGGMGNVYLAEDLQLARKVAIKTIRSDLSGNEDVQKRIGRECIMHAAIGVHPNIVALYDKIVINGNIYLIMEYVDGVLLSESLSAQFNEKHRYSLHYCIDIIRQILNGLERIHEKNIIHRDIKPSNIIVKQHAAGKFSAKLMDFGIARAEAGDHQLTQLTTVDTSGPGTPAYMAPERIDPKTFGAISSATDLYSVGVILFQLLSDGPPFRGTLTEILIGHLTSPPDLSLLQAAIPVKLRLVMEKALQKQQIQRYSDARLFSSDLLAAIEEDKSVSINSSTLWKNDETEQTMLANEITPLTAAISNTIGINAQTNTNSTGKYNKKFVIFINGNRKKISAVVLLLFAIILSYSLIKNDPHEKFEPVVREEVKKSRTLENEHNVVQETQLSPPVTATSPLRSDVKVTGQNEASLGAPAVQNDNKEEAQSALENMLKSRRDAAPKVASDTRNSETTRRKNSVKKIKKPAPAVTSQNAGSDWVVKEKNDRKIN